MQKAFQIRCVQARGGLVEIHTERRSFRVPIRFAATSRSRSPRLCVSTQHHPETVIPPVQGNLDGDFWSTHFEPCSHRTSLRRAAGEGMAPGESGLNRPGLIGRASSDYRQSAGCNSAPREKGRLGIGNHWPRLFQMRSDRPTAMYANANHCPDNALGVVCARSLPQAMSVNQQPTNHS